MIKVLLAKHELSEGGKSKILSPFQGGLLTLFFGSAILFDVPP
jgi:hypothetical protein